MQAVDGPEKGSFFPALRPHPPLAGVINYITKTPDDGVPLGPPPASLFQYPRAMVEAGGERVPGDASFRRLVATMRGSDGFQWTATTKND